LTSRPNDVLNVDALLHVGVSKSGKTYTLQHSVGEAATRAGRRFLVLDRLAEWPGNCRAPMARGETTSDARAAIRDEAPITLIQPPRSFDGRGSGDLPEFAEGFVRLALELGVTLVLPEAHLYAPKRGKLYPYMTELVTAYRHYKAGLWADSQRFAQVHEHVVSQAEAARFFAMRSESDKKRARDEGGPELESLIVEALTRLGNSDPGWHVRIGAGAPVNPYRLEKV
jgi:DNA helicase HerA-like ATPase